MNLKNEIGAIILQVVLGVSFFIHGLVKFQGGIENTAGWFDSIGIPGFMAYVVAAIELVGGIALVIGLGTRIVSSLFVLLMAGAIITAKLPGGFLGNGQGAGYELDLAFLAMALFLAIKGNTQFSITKVFSKGESA